MIRVYYHDYELTKMCFNFVESMLKRTQMPLNAKGGLFLYYLFDLFPQVKFYYRKKNIVPFHQSEVFCTT